MSTPNTLRTRILSAGPRSLNKSTREATFIASTDAIDSYGEIVAQNWDLTRYRANPVVLFAHNSREPIGRATSVGVVGGRLECTIQFAEGIARAEEVWSLVQQGMLKAVSVGFRPREVRAELRDGKTIYVLDDNELHEISIVSVPANPEALAKSGATSGSLAAPAAAPPATGRAHHYEQGEELGALFGDGPEMRAAAEAFLDTLGESTTERAERAEPDYAPKSPPDDELSVLFDATHVAGDLADLL